MIGLIADICISDTCNPEEIVLKYSIKESYIDNTLNLYSSLEEFQGIKRLNIFKFHEDTNMLLPNPDGDSYNDSDELKNNTSPYVYTLNAKESVDAFAKGMLLGEFDEADNFETLAGQITGSFIPFYADGRDYFANIIVHQSTGDAIVNLFFCLADLAPIGVATDVTKVSTKIGKFFIKFSDDAPKVIEAIIRATKLFPDDDLIPALAKAIPASSLDDVVDSIKSGDKITKAEYAKLYNFFETTGTNPDEALGFIAKNADEINFKPQCLIDELTSSGKKFTLEEVEFVVKTPDGNLMWLEKGDERKGLLHILYGAPGDPGHMQDFANRGINDVKTFLYNVVQSNPIKTGKKGRENGRIDKWAEYIVNGEKNLLAYGDNGYIFSFYPI